MTTPTIALERLPGYSQLYRDYVRGHPAVRRLCPEAPDRTTLSRVAASLVGRAPDCGPACRALEGQAARLGLGERARANIVRLSRGGCVAAISGAPPGQHGGPLRVLLAALSVIRLAEMLEIDGVPAVPLFLVGASQPADWRLGWLDSDGGLREDAFLPSAQGGSDPEAVRLLEACQARRETAGAPLASLMAELTAPWGLVVVDAADRQWQRLESDSLVDVRRRETELVRLVESQDRRLRESGYGSATLGQDSLDSRDAAAPGLLRPILDSAGLPVAAAVGGSGEIEGFLRALPLWGCLGRPAPVFWPRPGATLIDRRCTRILERYGAGVSDLFDGFSAVADSVWARQYPTLLPERFDGMSREVEHRLDVLGASLGDGAGSSEVDPALEEARTRMLYQVGKLRDRALGGQRVRREALVRQLRRACDLLAPGGALQEDVLGTGYFLLRCSRRLPEVLHEALRVGEPDHRVIAID